MNTIKTTIRDRRIEVAAPNEMPDGTDVLVDVTPIPVEKIGIDEPEWRDDPEALADWEAWLKTIEPIIRRFCLRETICTLAVLIPYFNHLARSLRWEEARCVHYFSPGEGERDVPQSGTEDLHQFGN